MNNMNTVGVRDFVYFGTLLVAITLSWASTKSDVALNNQKLDSTQQDISAVKSDVAATKIDIALMKIDIAKLQQLLASNGISRKPAEDIIASYQLPQVTPTSIPPAPSPIQQLISYNYTGGQSATTQPEKESPMPTPTPSDQPTPSVSAILNTLLDIIQL